MTFKNHKATYDEGMCSIFHKWIEKRGGEPGNLDECYDFAKENGLYQAPKMSERRLFKMAMSRAIGRERVVDADGNPIRKNVVFRVKKGDAGQGYFYFWGELMRMKPQHVKMSMQQRLLGLANRAIQLDRDKTYYNEHNEFGAQLELDYDLNPHVENSKNPTEYPDERPDDDQIV